MQRRDVLAAGSTVLVAMAGCLGTPGDDDSPEGHDRENPTGVEEVSLAFTAALLEGDIEEMRRFVHTDSTLADDLDDATVEEVDSDLEFIDVETLSESSIEAVTEVSVLSAALDNFEQRHELRIEDGLWRIFSIDGSRSDL